MSTLSKQTINSGANSVALILAPSNLGLRPLPNGQQQGAWRAPNVLMAAGLKEAVNAVKVITLERPQYCTNQQLDSRILNGPTIREYSRELASKVKESIALQHFPIVIGGDCSILLGCLLGSRQMGGRGVIHIDGHSDFFHPGNYDTSSRLGTAAGMDLALLTGRGESLLTKWPNVIGPLVDDEDVIQIGERDSLRAEFQTAYADIMQTKMCRFIIQDVLSQGVESIGKQVTKRLVDRELDSTWLHIDFDVLDKDVLPAVDSPGSPGLDFHQLSSLIRHIVQSRRIIGASFTIYDPDRDPSRKYPQPLIDCISCSITNSNNTLT